jgi:hypothetical protein
VQRRQIKQSTILTGEEILMATLKLMPMGDIYEMLKNWKKEHILKGEQTTLPMLASFLYQRKLIASKVLPERFVMQDVSRQYIEDTYEERGEADEYDIDASEASSQLASRIECRIDDVLEEFWDDIPSDVLTERDRDDDYDSDYDSDDEGDSNDDDESI